MGLRVEPDNGPPVELLPGGSRLSLDEEAEPLIVAALSRLRASNRKDAARPKSIAIRSCEDALLWLRAYGRGEVR